MKNKNINIITSLYGLGIIIFVWYLMHLFVDGKIIPNPVETLKTLLEMLQGDLFKHLAYSGYRVLMAILISILIGLPMGILTGLNNKIDKIVSPIAYILYPLPKVAFLPIFMLLFGLGEVAKISLLVSIIIFQVQLAVRDGVKDIEQDMIRSAETLGLEKWDIFKHLIFPAIMPKLFSALRITIGISIAALFLSENFATSYGIGYFIMNSWIMVDYKAMFAGIVVLGIFGGLLFKIIDVLENRVCKWKNI